MKSTLQVDSINKNSTFGGGDHSKGHSFPFFCARLDRVQKFLVFDCIFDGGIVPWLVSISKLLPCNAEWLKEICWSLKLDLLSVQKEVGFITTWEKTGKGVGFHPNGSILSLDLPNKLASPFN